MKVLLSKKQVAIVYDRVNKWGGAERVLLTLHEMFPEAPLYTSVYDAKGAPWAKKFPKIIPSFLQKIPFVKRNHEWMAVFMPMAFESFDFSDYDLVISVTSEAAKGIVTGPGTRHICYCLTPTRYLWSHYNEYLDTPGKRIMSWPVVAYLRWWDKVAAQRPDVMVAISTEVQERIKKYYHRDSQLIFPPINLYRKSLFLRGPRLGESASHKLLLDTDYYLVVSRLVKYKRVDLVIKAFNKMGKRLIVVGKGREERKLRKMAKANVAFVRDLSDWELTNYFKNAKALVVPQNEDFGLVMVEAMAAGTPVLAYRKGGALDIVSEGLNGLFFDKQTVKSIIKITDRFETMTFDSKRIKESVGRFSAERFGKEFLDLI